MRLMEPNMKTGNNAKIRTEAAAFSLIELLVAVAIIAVLAAVGAAYYGDYVSDARHSVLQKNLHTINEALNSFRADQGRGPLLVPFVSGPNTLVDTAAMPAFKLEELVNGPLQYIDGTLRRRTVIKYLSSVPELPNPFAKGNFTQEDLEFFGATVYYYDLNSNGKFDLDSEFAVSLTDHANPENNPIIFGIKPATASGWTYTQWTASAPLDYTRVSLKTASFKH